MTANWIVRSLTCLGLACLFAVEFSPSARASTDGGVSLALTTHFTTNLPSTLGYSVSPGGSASVEGQTVSDLRITNDGARAVDVQTSISGDITITSSTNTQVAYHPAVKIAARESLAAGASKDYFLVIDKTDSLPVGAYTYLGHASGEDLVSTSKAMDAVAGPVYVSVFVYH